MKLNVPDKVGGVLLSNLNETSDKVFLDSLVLFVPDDYCPPLDDEFAPDERFSPFKGVISDKPSNWTPEEICQDNYYLANRLEEKLELAMEALYDTVPRHKLHDIDISDYVDMNELAIEVLDDAGYSLSLVYGVSGPALGNGKPELKYSFDKIAGAKIHGYTLLSDSAPNEYNQMFLDRANGQNIALHAINTFSKNEVNEKISLVGSFSVMHNQERDDKVFDFVEKGGQFIPASEVKNAFALARLENLKEQIKEGKNLDSLPAIVRDIPSLCVQVIPNNPMDIYKVKPDFITEGFLKSVISDMSTRKDEPDNKKRMWKLLNGVGDIKKDMFPFAAAEAISSGLVTGRDLGLDKDVSKDVYKIILNDNPELLNNGKTAGMKLSDIPTDILVSSEVVNIIADQMTPPPYRQAVKFENLPKALQDNPVIYGRASSLNLNQLSSVPDKFKNNPDFLKSLFKPIRRHATPEVFNKLYGGIKHAPDVAKEFAVSTIYLNSENVMAVLEASFGKQELNEMIMNGQKELFGNEPGFMYNTSNSGKFQLLSAELKVNAKGQVNEVKMKFDNGEKRSKDWTPTKEYSQSKFWVSNPEIKVPVNGHNFIKDDIRDALGGAEPKTAWTPWYDKEEAKRKELTKHLSIDSDRSIGG